MATLTEFAVEGHVHASSSVVKGRSAPKYQTNRTTRGPSMSQRRNAHVGMPFMRVSNQRSSAAGISISVR